MPLPFGGSRIRLLRRHPVFLHAVPGALDGHRWHSQASALARGPPARPRPSCHRHVAWSSPSAAPGPDRACRFLPAGHCGLRHRLIPGPVLFSCSTASPPLPSYRPRHHGRRGPRMSANGQPDGPHPVRGRDARAATRADSPACAVLSLESLRIGVNARASSPAPSAPEKHHNAQRALPLLVRCALGPEVLPKSRCPHPMPGSVRRHDIGIGTPPAPSRRTHRTDRLAGPATADPALEMRGTER